MGLARLFYHEPRYAFVDEGTSAVSSDVEGLLYERAKSKGISEFAYYEFTAFFVLLDTIALITISTRASLKRYHTFTLTLGLGESGVEWELQRIGTQAEKSSVEKALHELRERLAHVEQWQKRRQEIDEELNKVWVDGGDELPPPAYVAQDESLTIEEGANVVSENEAPER